jgi:hypothetical protein
MATKSKTASSKSSQGKSGSKPLKDLTPKGGKAAQVRGGRIASEEDPLAP